MFGIQLCEIWKGQYCWQSTPTTHRYRVFTGRKGKLWWREYDLIKRVTL